MSKKLIVITGASSGFGEAMARDFSASGHPVLLLARRQQKLQALCEELGELCTYAEVDVADLDSFTAAVKEAESKFGPVDCLVNNAGMMLLGDPAQQDINEWYKMLDVNVKGVLNGIHIVLKGMIERNHGTVINISSLAGRVAYPNCAAYSGTKFAVHAITESIRGSVASSNVRFSVISPGAAETEALSHNASEELKNNYQQWKQSMDGFLAPQDVANAVMYAYQQPQHICVREIALAMTKQER